VIKVAVPVPPGPNKLNRLNICSGKNDESVCAETPAGKRNPNEKNVSTSDIAIFFIIY